MDSLPLHCHKYYLIVIKKSQNSKNLNQQGNDQGQMYEIDASRKIVERQQYLNFV